MSCITFKAVRATRPMEVSAEFIGGIGISAVLLNHMEIIVGMVCPVSTLLRDFNNDFSNDFNI